MNDSHVASGADKNSKLLNFKTTLSADCEFADITETMAAKKFGHANSDIIPCANTLCMMVIVKGDSQIQNIVNTLTQIFANQHGTIGNVAICIASITILKGQKDMGRKKSFGQDKLGMKSYPENASIHKIITAKSHNLKENSDE